MKCGPDPSGSHGLEASRAAAASPQHSFRAELGSTVLSPSVVWSKLQRYIQSHKDVVLKCRCTVTGCIISADRERLSLSNENSTHVPPASPVRQAPFDPLPQSKSHSSSSETSSYAVLSGRPRLLWGARLPPLWCCRSCPRAARPDECRGNGSSICASDMRSTYELGHLPQDRRSSVRSVEQLLSARLS